MTLNLDLSPTRHAHPARHSPYPHRPGSITTSLLSLTPPWPAAEDPKPPPRAKQNPNSHGPIRLPPTTHLLPLKYSTFHRQLGPWNCTLHMSATGMCLIHVREVNHGRPNRTLPRGDGIGIRGPNQRASKPVSPHNRPPQPSQ